MTDQGGMDNSNSNNSSKNIAELNCLLVDCGDDNTTNTKIVNLDGKLVESVSTVSQSPLQLFKEIECTATTATTNCNSSNEIELATDIVESLTENDIIIIEKTTNSTSFDIVPLAPLPSPVLQLLQIPTAPPAAALVIDNDDDKNNILTTNNVSINSESNLMVKESESQVEIEPEQSNQLDLNTNTTTTDVEREKSVVVCNNMLPVIDQNIEKQEENHMNNEKDQQALNSTSNLTEKTIEDFCNLSIEQQKEDIVMEYLNNCIELPISDTNNHHDDDKDIIEIQDENFSSNNNNNNVIIIDDSMLNQSDSEEDDKLKPLIMDNHSSNIDQQQQQQQHLSPTSIEYFNYQDGNNGNGNNMKITSSQHLEVYDNNSKDFCSSNGSDLSTQFDHQDLVNNNLSENSDDFKMSSDLETSFIDHHGHQHGHHHGHHGHHHGHHEHHDQNLPLTTTPTIDCGELKEIDTLTVHEIPDDKLCEEIVEQVEYYFSDDSILKDAFLLKHVRRNKEGFVSLKLVSSFKRVRQFTKDWRVVGHAIRRKCQNIELNDIGTKIRRIEPLPTFDETMSSRTIVATDLPFDRLCIEKITDIFSKFGEIALIRILRPGMTIPIDVRQFMNKYPEMQQKECALIEYLDSSAARQAKLTDGNNYQVFDMVAPKKKTGKKSTATTITKFIENYKYIDNNYEKSRGGGGGDLTKISSRNSIDFRNNNKYGGRNNNNEYFTKQSTDDINHQNFIYQPPHMPFRRHSTNMQQDNLMPHIHHIQTNYNNTNLMNDNNNGVHFTHYSPRRVSNCSMNSNLNENNHLMTNRKYSTCSDGYSSCSEMSRRTSTCSNDQQHQQTIRRNSNCSSVGYCPCSRKMSQCSDNYRNNTHCPPDHINNNNIRRFSSNNSYQQQNYDRNYPNNERRISMDSNYERKMSINSTGQGHHHNIYEKFTNGFDPNRKLSTTEQYHNGRRISTDSGYDRKMSFGSDYSAGSPRSRTSSFINNCPHNKIEAVVRTPIGPDGSKGFTSRIRKVGQVTVQPVN